MYSPEDRETRGGISAVLVANDHLDSIVLDLAAVLAGLVSDTFEIVVVAEWPARIEGVVEELRARAPGLPLRLVQGDSLAAGCDAAQFDLIFTCAPDGQFDVRELNHLLEAIDRGADVAAGYRPRPTDGILRYLQRWGWRVEVDCAFKLLRRAVWTQLARGADPRPTTSCVDLLTRVRRSGFRVVEVPVSHRRPTLGVLVSGRTRAA